MEHTCEWCTYKTTNRYNYNRHIASNIHKNDKEKDSYVCKYCDKPYKHRSSLSKHIKYSCTKNKDEDLKELVRLLNVQIDSQSKQLEEQRKSFQSQLHSQSKQIEKLMGKLEINGSFNTHIQNITLLSYRDTDISHLTEQDYKSSIKKVNFCVKNMIEKIHFNPLKPENMNIYISNMKDKYLMVYDGNNWNLANKKEELDKLYEEKEMMLEEWLETNDDKDLKDKFMKYLNNKDNDECINRIKEEIKLMMYNKKNLALE